MQHDTRITLALTTFTAALVGAAALSRAEDPPTKAEIALVAAPGKPVHFVFTHETAQKLPLMGETVDSTASGTTEFSVEIKERAADGTATGVVRFGRMTGAFSNPLLGEKSFDSAEAAPADEMDQLMSAAVIGLAYSEFAVTFDSGGAITKVEGIAAARETATKRLAAEGLAKTALTTSISEKAVQEHVGWALVATPLPAGTITAGQSWDDSDTVPSTARGTTIKTKQKLSVKSIDAERITVTGTGTLDVTASMRGGAPTIKETSCASEVEISRADGLPAAATISLSMSAELSENRGPMSQTTKASTKRVAAWPSAEKEKPAPTTPAAPEKPPVPSGK